MSNKEACWACSDTGVVTSSSNGSGLRDEACKACEDRPKDPLQELQALGDRLVRQGLTVPRDRYDGIASVNRVREEQGYEPLEGYLPRVVGNALIDSDGKAHQLRLLEKLYLRIGLVTIDALDRQYRRPEQAQGGIG